MHTGAVILSGPGYWMGFPFREEAEVKGNEYRSQLLMTKMGSPQADRRSLQMLSSVGRHQKPMWK